MDNLVNEVAVFNVEAVAEGRAFLGLGFVLRVILLFCLFSLVCLVVVVVVPLV
jgi:hypothetical protein